MNLNEIDAKLVEIRNSLDNKELRKEDLEKLTNESKDLLEQRKALIEEMRQDAIDAINSRKEEKSMENENLVVAPMTKRAQLNLLVGKLARNRALTDEEKRAVGTAFTTTADTYVNASSGADGVNNGGIFIKTEVLFDLLREDKKLSPILNDIHFTSIKGLTSYPYRFSRDNANAKQETKGTNDNQMEWKKLNLTSGWLQIVIPVTDELLALTDFDFGSYLVDQMLQDLEADWCADLIYGAGVSDKVMGISELATEAEYEEGKVLDGVVAAVKTLKAPYRSGAKIYVAQDIYDSIYFTKNTNGDYLYPIFNNQNGINLISNLPVVVDENLKDGEIIIGNVSRWFKANVLIPMQIETDRHARQAVTDYIAKEYCATGGMSGAFIYLKKKVEA